MIITDEWITDNCSKSRGWTKKQLAALGVSWPPKSGWKKRVIGMEISEENRIIFENEKKIRNSQIEIFDI